MTNPKSIFADIQKKIKEDAANAASAPSTPKIDNVFKPTKAGTMTVRLLWLPPADDVKRDFPMINSNVHRFYNPNAAKKYVKVTCPTSQYMDGETATGFGHCCICNAVSKFYKESANSPSAKELYSTFRRAVEGYIPVYVVTGPEELQGKVKILQYGKQFRDFFNRKIFGMAAKTDSEPIDTDEIIGLEAFMYYDSDEDEVVTTGYDLIISTTVENIAINGKKTPIPKYSLDFSRRPKTIDEIEGIDLTSKSGIKWFKNLNNEIGFDKNFLTYSTEEDRENFLKTYVTKETNDETLSKSDIDSLVEDHQMNESEEEEEEVKPVKKTSKKAPPIEEEDDEDEAPKKDGGDIDVDALLAGLN